MNLNNNPTSEELRTLLDACEEGDGMQVLWVERLGEVQVALMLAETQVEWLKGMNNQVLFQYDSKTKSDREGGGNAVDELYIATLFERLMRDWNARVIDIEAAPAAPVDEKASLVVLRVRARQNRYWFEALTLAELEMQTQLNALLGQHGTSVVKNQVEKLASKTLTRKVISRDLYDRIRKFIATRNEMVLSFLSASIPSNQLEPIVRESDGLIHELSQIPLAG
jgi:hypothetical protein